MNLIQISEELDTEDYSERENEKFSKEDFN